MSNSSSSKQVQRGRRHQRRAPPGTSEDPDAILARLPVGTRDSIRVVGGLLKKFNHQHATKHQGVSFDTMLDRQRFLAAFFRELRRHTQFNNLDLRQLANRHVTVMVARWYRRERVKNFDEAPAISYRPIETMNNTAWQRARREAGLPDLHVHDLRHTVGMRLREAGVPESTVADTLWHSNPSMTRHYSTAQIVELPRWRRSRKTRAAGTRAWRHCGASTKKQCGGLWGKKSPKSPPARKNGLEVIRKLC